MGSQTPNSKNDRHYNVQKKKTKRQPMVDKTVNRKPEGKTVSAPLVAPVVLLLFVNNQVIS